ncbi:MAG: Fis family transcriptional regulator [candidate division NC10 bacterium RIFCSPLOWO2_12_FULL_66_18]|nr:MAG: Fis family transcriptional regulator [candidate division NC10 bacterium RIFCSPLOWO2_02_FULL_66_22]OGB95682.1 MAG: Fis family transcriptional regulator [candidate division NC10 bacterium RIFCSPLOWO2_12_FULL_66_18]
MTMGDARIRVLVVDDDLAVRQALSRTLEKIGYDVVVAEDGQEGLDRLRQGGIHIVLADLKMPKLSGNELLKAAKAIAPDVEVIVITGHGTVEDAVEAMKEGAYDFITKPFKRVQLEKTIRKAAEKQALVLENRVLQARVDELQGAGQIIGTSPAILRTLELVNQVAPSTATVLIQGESGTGKELIANAVHHGSPRRARPFIKVNCAALPETLLESELFGYERGAFTGAVARREGRFELADGGTLFMDEIGDLSLATQAKLLRVLQEGEFERLGGTRTLKVDVRLVAATHADLATLVREKGFREDLFYRLNVITIQIPPLRERREDIPLLAQHFLGRYAVKNAKTITGFTDEALDLLQSYAWPGNVRELENVIERAVVLTRGSMISPADLPETLAGADQAARHLVISVGTPLEEVEDRLIEETLRYARGDKTLAAKLLGIATRTIYRRMKGEPQPPGAG